MTVEQLLKANAERSLYFFDPETGRVVFLPQDWAYEMSDIDDETQERQANCWFGNDECLAFLERTTPVKNEWLTTDAQAFFNLTDLCKMQEINEDTARQRDPDLFRLLDAVNSGEAK